MKTFTVIICIAIGIYIGYNVAIPEQPEYDTYCDLCGIDLMYNDAVEDNHDDDYCYPCAFICLKKCPACEEYFTNEYISAIGYCEDCTYENFELCCFCGACIEEHTTITVNNTKYPVCPDCLTSYFRNIEDMTPCYYCIHCGELFTGKYYEHEIYEGACYCEPCAIATNFEDLKK